jgi:hypothetical protein
MNPIRLVRAAQRIYTYRDRIRAFLLCCEDPDQAFYGSVQPGELVYLKELVGLANSLPGPIVEVGTLFGFTAQHIAASKRDDKELITIDNFSWNPVGMSEPVHREFCKRSLFYLVERCRTRLFEGTNRDFYESYAGQAPSMVFIDAVHTYEEVVVDIKWAMSKGAAIISGHDYSNRWPGVKKAVDEFFGREIKVVESLWAHHASFRSPQLADLNRSRPSKP